MTPTLQAASLAEELGQVRSTWGRATPLHVTNGPYEALWTALGFLETFEIGPSSLCGNSISQLCIPPPHMIDKVGHNACCIRLPLLGLELRRRQVAQGRVEASLIPPVDPFSGCPFDLTSRTPRAGSPDDFGLSLQSTLLTCISP